MMESSVGLGSGIGSTMPFDGEKLRQLRMRQGYSQEDLGSLARVAARTVRSAEAGGRVPRGYIQRALAGALGCALEDLQSRGRGAGVPDAPPVQNQLPVPPRPFVGREAELERLTAALRDGGRVVIEGASGVGKTALASVFAWSASHQYPDGMIFVDLQGASERLQVEHAMRHVVWSLRPAPILVDTHLDLHAAYRALLREKRILLVLDDAADAAQIAPLLPPPPSALIVTARESLASLDLTRLVLEPLTRTASVDLLRGCGCAAEDAERLAAVCGDLPLILTVVAREAAREDCDVEELLRKLESERSRLHALDAIAPAGRISTSLQRGITALTPELGRALALLQVFPQELDRASAARVWNVEPRQAGATLRELSMRHLIQHCTGRGQDARYRVHDLVRIAAAGHASEAQVAEARARHAQHYLTLLQPFDPLADDAAADIEEVSARIHSDAANLYAALNWCTRRAPSAEALQLLPSVHRAGALDLVLGSDEPAGAGRAWMPQLYLKLGDLCRIEGDYATAARALERAVREVPALGNPHLVLLAGIMLGLTHVLQGEMDRALRVLRPHARLARKRGDAQWESFALMALGFAFLGHGDRKAEALFTASLAAAAKRANPMVRSEARCGLASCLTRRGELGRAHALAGEALEEVRRVGPTIGSAARESSALIMLALICLHSDLATATRHAEDALRIAEAGAVGHLRVRALYVRAAVALASPSWTDAGPFVEAALEIDAALQPYAHRRPARELAARYMVRARRLDEAVALLESLVAAEPAGRLGARQDCETRMSLASLLAMLGRKAAAREQTAAALERIARFRMLGDRSLVLRVRSLHARLATADAA